MAMNGSGNGGGAVSLRGKQVAALKQLINLNSPISESKAVEPVWKLLIFDRYGQDVISPLLSVKELRELGVTLHLRLDQIREALPDVSAVYLSQATAENVRSICQDLQSGLYESYYLNFISPLNRPLLEELATTAVQTGCVPSVKKVFDQYLNFICLEDDLFTIQKHDEECPLSFYAINRRNMDEATMNAMMDLIADSLFSVCVTMGTVPIIRCPKGNAAEAVAERLDRKLRDNLRDTRNNLFAGDGVRLGSLSFQRPVLILLDRGLDLATMLHHTWTYQALIHDVLSLELNRVEVVQGEEGREKTKEYDLNASDNFWLNQKGKPFPEVAEAVQEELETYRCSEEEIRKLKAAMGLDTESAEAVTLVTDTTSKLTSTVSSLPELLEKKRLIDQHMNLATAVLDVIKARKLDQYFEMEEKLLQRSASDRSALLSLLSDPSAGNWEDKLRLILQDLVYWPGADPPELSQMLQAAGLAEGEQSAAALKFLKFWKSIHSQHRGVDSNSLYAGMGTNTVSMFPKLLSKGSAFVMEGVTRYKVKNLVNKKHKLPFTKLVDAVMELKQTPETEDWRYFDPKLLRSSEAATPRARSAFPEAWVFVVGGGNYVEYQNLVDYAGGKTANKPTSPRRILYGCTDLVNSSQFLAQLSRLGAEM